MLSCGPSLSPETTDIVVRNWGALIALVGVTLIYAARKPAVRPLALTVAREQGCFIALVLSHVGRFLGYQAGIAVFVDALWVVVFASYLLAVRRAPTSDARVAATIKTVTRMKPQADLTVMFMANSAERWASSAGVARGTAGRRLVEPARPRRFIETHLAKPSRTCQ